MAVSAVIGIRPAIDGRAQRLAAIVLQAATMRIERKLCDLRKSKETSNTL